MSDFSEFNPLQVFNRPATLRLLGLSDQTWMRLEKAGDVPPKTRLSEGRVGYRASDLKDWLDSRRQKTA